MSAMRRSPRWTGMAPPSYTVRPPQREMAQDSALLGLEPVGERLEAALLDAYPEPLLLGLVARTDRERRQNAALEATDPLERRDEPRARQVLACALGAFREQPRGEVARKGVAVRLVLREVLLHVLAIEPDTRQVRRQRVGPERQPLDALGGVTGEAEITLVGERAHGHHECLGPADLLPLSERLDGRSRDEDQEGDLGPRTLELGDLSPHVSVARLHRFGGDHLEAVARQVLREGRAERLTILVVLVERGELLVLPLAHQVVDHHLRHAVAHHHSLEDPAPAASDGRALVRKQERDLVLLEVLERRNDRRRTLRHDDREDTVLLDELLGVGLSLQRSVTVVVPHRPYLPAVDAPGVVDDLEVEVYPELRHLLAREGQRARERVRPAEQDLGVGHALLCASRDPGQHGEGEQREEDPHVHWIAFRHAVEAHPS